jgi:hypothetical protein
MIKWFSDQAVGWMSIKMVDWIPSRGKIYLPQTTQTNCGAHQPCIRHVAGVLLPVVNWLGHEANKLPQSSMAIKNEWFCAVCKKLTLVFAFGISAMLTQPLGSPKNRWEDDIRNYMKKLKIKNWTS